MGYSVKYLSCVKVVLILFNFLLFCFGMVLMGIGIWLRVDPKMYEPSRYIEIDNYIAAAWIMMVSGFIVVLIGFCGCYGAVTESPCILCTYFVIMSLLVALEIAGVVLAAAHGFGDKLEFYLNQQILLQIQQRQFSDRARKFLDFLQVKLRCCGATNFNDYHRYGMEIPVSCGGERTNFVNNEGCGRVLRNFIDLRGGLTLALCGLTAILQMASVIAAVSVYCAVRHAEIDSN